MEKARGKVLTYGEDINTDVILPGQYLNVTDPQELASHCMESEDPDFINKVNAGDIMVTGKNFGCGSSREHAPLAIKYAGISCVIAPTFARIFYRNAINIGLPIIECDKACEINEGDELSVDFDTGVIINHTSGKTYESVPFPPFMQKIIACGGLVEYTKNMMESAK